jgi:2',3'-cyclic-nucleotide 2'-phosphodiesterase (5'-nucleotidase family)
MRLHRSISGLRILLLSGMMLFSCRRHFVLDNHQHQQYSMDQRDVDSSLVRYYLPFKAKMEVEMKRVIGQNDQELSKPSAPETLLGDFFADAVLHESRKLYPEVQISFATTKGGMRNPLPKGAVTVAQMFELMPFENELVVLKMSGLEIQKLIEFIAGSQGQPVAGLRMKVKDKRAYDVTISGHPFNINEDYSVVTSDYLASNTDEQRLFSNPVSRTNLGKKVRDALMEYVEGLTKNGKAINMALDGRVTYE